LEEEIIAIGAVPGYASPRGLKDALIVVDDLIPESPNLVAGANKEGYHTRNVNYGRDFEAAIVTDLAMAEDGSACEDCGNKLRAVRGVEVGNIFKLGSRYSESIGCNFLDKDGISKPVIMGSYGIGSGRLLACVAEEFNDENGLIWPVTVAPYHIHLVLLSAKSGAETTLMAEELYTKLQANNLEVLYDDRDESPGVKFNDADLIGIPIRLTVSTRSLKQDAVEFKRRDRDERTMIPFDDLIHTITQEIENMKSDIAARVVDIPFKD
jgi:prolyl-tRNA synthetase